ncbi:hypothetical protein FITA111629_04490 [Filibacter tadaridae]|uniref:Uncharacterized protein n=1 Tax=Filibacter tadaridae TaxID=2483811 RepID=A0A3P5XU03_9BACL|nr:hypothetical protein FILTAD_02733 [Filibacter tadaridae]
MAEYSKAEVICILPNLVNRLYSFFSMFKKVYFDYAGIRTGNVFILQK